MSDDAPSALAFAPESLDERFGPRTYQRLARLIHQHSGIKMPDSKRTMLAVRLRPRLAALRIPHLDGYCDYLFEQGGLESELVHLINAVSTNKTDFFREPAHFDFLRDHVAPDLLKAGQRAMKLWSAAASIGAEAYTIAMVLEEFRRAQRAPDYAILGTDISTAALAQAHAGRFPTAMAAPIPPELRARYLMRARNPERDLVRIVPQLRAKISWAQLNLMDARYPVEHDIDVIFCRNVLIYFDKPTQQEVLTRLCQHLRPGGHLILGHSESGAGAGLALRSVVNTIFQKP